MVNNWNHWPKKKQNIKFKSSYPIFFYKKEHKYTDSTQNALKNFQNKTVFVKNQQVHIRIFNYFNLRHLEDISHILAIARKSNQNPGT